jgi:hypothetical protein
MSLNNEYTSDDEIEKCFCERAQNSVTVDSMIKWISSLEDKVVDSFARIETTVTRIHEEQARLAAENKELICCNRELAVELSKRLYHADFKSKKVLNPALVEDVVSGALHPKVIPFVYLGKEEAKK